MGIIEIILGLLLSNYIFKKIMGEEKYYARVKWAIKRSMKALLIIIIISMAFLFGWWIKFAV